MFGWITELDEYIIKTEKSKLTAAQIADHFDIPLQVLCQQVIYIYHRTVKDHVSYLKEEKEPTYPFLYTPMEKWMYGNNTPMTKDKTTIVPLEAYNGRFTEFVGSIVTGYKVPYSKLITMAPEEYPRVDPGTWEGGPFQRWEHGCVAPFSRFNTVDFRRAECIVSTYKEIGAIGAWVDPDEKTGEMSYFFGHALYNSKCEWNKHLERTEIVFPVGRYTIYKDGPLKEEVLGSHSKDLNNAYTGSVIRRSGCYRMLSGEDCVPYDFSKTCIEACYGDGKVCLLVPFADERGMFPLQCFTDC